MATITDPVPTSKSEDTALPVNNSSFVDMSRFSSLAKLLRVTAYVLRFIDNCQGGRSTGSQETLTREELHRAEEVYIRSCKMSKYQAEVKDIQTKRYKLPLSRQLIISRQWNSEVPWMYPQCTTRRSDQVPVPLPAKHSFTNLVIKDAHSRLLHAGVS
ncbi:uncharacterized protein LOC128554524 [Mercenaria mercenaria]|uniref:uncharacterized protein LOC128554524 n=1 Tax=Mercenaria mercenaria TaxID=6596 RepID=UPI00234F35A7|nr:uncharacterized protein LOC128554524 [Mercenaria mercenaria]